MLFSKAKNSLFLKNNNKNCIIWSIFLCKVKQTNKKS